MTYGLIGAFVFRFISIATAQLLLRFRIVKLVGGIYLFYVAAKYFWEKWRERQSTQAGSSGDGPTSGGENSEVRLAGFWSTVVVIELTDIAFAVDFDSRRDRVRRVPLLPGHTGWHRELWVVMTGGMLGVMLMRYAAVVFIEMLERFPRFEAAAYLLVMVIGGKLVLDWKFNTSEQHVLDFHSPSSPAFWIFWILMICSFCVGFIPQTGSNGRALTNPYHSRRMK